MFYLLPMAEAFRDAGYRGSACLCMNTVLLLVLPILYLMCNFFVGESCHRSPPGIAQ